MTSRRNANRDDPLPDPARDHAVLMIHGIRTQGEWETRIRQTLIDGDTTLNPIAIGYGFFDVFRFLTPISAVRKRPIERVRRRIDVVLRDGSAEKVSIIAHSYGTYIVGKLLQDSDLSLHRLILCGSILPKDYKWVAVKAKLSAVGDPDSPQTYVVNDCGWKDIWPVLARFSTWGYGATGRFGFQDPLVFDRYHEMAHSGYFTDDFAEKYWLPLLASNSIEENVAERPNEPWWISVLTLVKLPIVLMLAAFLLFVLPLLRGSGESDPVVAPPTATSTTTPMSPIVTTLPPTTTTAASVTTTTTTTTTLPDPREERHQVAADHAASAVAELIEIDNIETLVGHLIVASFPGRDLYNERYDLAYAETLLRDSRVGGFILSATNCNINNGSASPSVEASCAAAYGYDENPDTIGDVAKLTGAIQSLAFDTAIELDVPYLPSFIAADHEGDGPPLTHLVNEFHSIPSQMAMGATWDAGSAFEVGQAVGSDLASVGVNLLLGPVADVMREPKPSPTDIGVRTFGSSPFLVAEMAARYVEGINAGSSAMGGTDTPRVLTIAKHFPGHGASNEDPDNNLSEVLYPNELSDLDESGLYPFGQLAQEAYIRRPTGIMSSHLLYPNIAECGEGAIFTFSNECAEAFTDHMAETHDGFAAWRSDSLLVTDSLGVRGLRKAEPSRYQNNEALCDLAADALKAGHDLLLLGRWTPTDADKVPEQRWSRELDSIQSTVECLAGRFRANEPYRTPDGSKTMRARLTEAAARVLKAKFLLYPEIGDLPGPDQRRLDVATASADRARAEVGAFRDSIEDVAAQAITEIPTGGTGSWTGLRATSSKSIVFVECWDDDGGLCPGNAGTLESGKLEALTQAHVNATFESIETIGLLSAWCVSDRTHDVSLAAFFKGEIEECGVEDAPPPETVSEEIQLAATALANADVVVFGISAADPDSVAMFGIEDVVASLDRNAETVLIATGRPYYRKRTALSMLDLYVATYSKIDTALASALQVVIRGWPADGTMPVHYPDVFGRAQFEQKEAEWLALQSR